MSGLLYSCKIFAKIDAINNLKERQVLAMSVALEECVGKSPNGTMHCLYFVLSSTYYEKEMAKKGTKIGIPLFSLGTQLDLFLSHTCN